MENQTKAKAIEKLLPKEKQFGNVTVRIEVSTIPEPETMIELIGAAFNGNPAVRCIQHIDTPLTGPVDYVMFAREVVQFYNDDLGDPNGLCSTLYQEIAKAVLPEKAKVHYCTDIV